MSKGQRFNLDKPLQDLQAHLEKRAEPASPLSGEGIMDIPLAHLQAAPWNARRFFAGSSLTELARDLKEKGQIHPILVRPLGSGYEVVVGERRLRAAGLAGLPSLKAQVRNLSDRQAQSLSLSENLSRTDLNAYEETLGYLQLLELELSPLSEFTAQQRGGESPADTVVRLLHQLNNERKQERGETKGTTLEASIRQVFVGQRIGFESFYKHRLPILRFPPDLIAPMQEGRLEYSKAALLAKVKDQAERHKLLGETLEHSLSVGILRNRLDKLGAGVDKLHQRAAKLARALKRSKLGPVKEGQVAELLGQLEALL